jgi:hypothetical protein
VRHAPQAHHQDDTREHERTGSGEERKALVTGQCERNQPRDGAERYHTDGCRGPLEVKVDRIKHGGLPCRRRSSNLRPWLVVVAAAIHDIVPLTSPTATAWAIAPPLRARSCPMVISASCRYEVPCSGSRAAGCEPYPTVMSQGPDYVQTQHALKGSGSIAMPRGGGQLRRAFQRTRKAPYLARWCESRAFPSRTFPLARNAAIAA